MESRVSKSPLEDRGSPDSESTFSSLDRLPGRVKASVDSQRFESFGDGFDFLEDKMDGSEEGVVKREGGGDSGFVTSPQVTNMLSSSHKSFFESKKPHNTSS